MYNVGLQVSGKQFVVEHDFRICREAIQPKKGRELVAGGIRRLPANSRKSIAEA
jgi:hypothetical protein